MGCFLSSNKPHPSSSKFHQQSSTSSRTPPPVDVETVKEVLSETPNHNPFMKIDDDHKKVASRHNSFRIRQQDHILEDPNISEIGSTMSESVSTTTFDDDYDVFRPKVIDRSPMKARNRQQASPVRRKEQSPVRVGSTPERNRRGTGFGSAGRQRPGSGNRSAARSRSPANRTVGGGGRDEIGRSMSSRRTGKSPGRVGSDLHERVWKPELRSGREREEGGWPPSGMNNDESLENPLVSLECFIFL